MPESTADHGRVPSEEQYPAPDLGGIALVDVMRALADPVRLQIIRVLASGEPLNRSTTDWGCDLSRATMSHHFRILREAGFTLTFVNGRAHRVQLRRVEFDTRFPGLLDLVARGWKTGREG